MKKLTLALILLIAVTGAALAVLKWVGIGPFAASQEVAASSDKPDPGAAAYFVALDTILVPLLKDDKVAGMVQIQVKLEVVGDNARDTVVQAKPRLSHAFFQELYAYIPRMTSGGVRLDVAVLKKRLQMVSDKTLGEGLVHDVLLQSVTEVPAS